MRETLTRVLRSYGFPRGGLAAGLLDLQSPQSQRTDCDFDPDAWDRGERDCLLASGIGRVVLSRLPAPDDLPSSHAPRAQPAWRAVIDMPEKADRTTLAALHARGVRGVRCDLATVRGDGLGPLLVLADRIVPFGWHIEIRLGEPGAVRALARAEWRLLQFPLAVCFSGLDFRAKRRNEEADLAYLLGLVQLGRYWLRLSGDDLASPQLKLFDEPPPLAPALQTIRKDRLIWGSGRQPGGYSAAHLDGSLRMLEKCLPHPADQQQVLIDNPARLYGFDQP